MNNQNDKKNLSTPNSQSTQKNQSTQNIQNTQSTQSTQNNQNTPPYTFLPRHGHYRNLRVYKVTEIIYDITYYFTHKFLSRGDRTVDQMIQAARSGKQNIAEGNQAAATSSETEIKLTNVAKASLEELLDDYEDYIRVRNLEQWGKSHPRYDKMIQYARSDKFHNEYALQIQHMNDEEISNLCITLIHQAISMLHNLITTMQNRFVTEGGIKERMHQARTGYRQKQDSRLTELEQSLLNTQQQLAQAQTEAEYWKSAYENLKEKLTQPSF